MKAERKTANPARIKSGRGVNISARYPPSIPIEAEYIVESMLSMKYMDALLPSSLSFISNVWYPIAKAGHTGMVKNKAKIVISVVKP